MDMEVTCFSTVSAEIETDYTAVYPRRQNSSGYAPFPGIFLEEWRKL
jgi:hypothetical protein